MRLILGEWPLQVGTHGCRGKRSARPWSRTGEGWEGGGAQGGDEDAAAPRQGTVSPPPPHHHPRQGDQSASPGHRQPPPGNEERPSLARQPPWVNLQPHPCVTCPLHGVNNALLSQHGSPQKLPNRTPSIPPPPPKQNAWKMLCTADG